MEFRAGPHQGLCNVYCAWNYCPLFVLGNKRYEARGGRPGVITDIAIWAVPFGIVGGRIYHVLSDWQIYFGAEGAGFVAALRIWDGGLGIWGAVALGAVGTWIGARRNGVALPPVADAIGAGISSSSSDWTLGKLLQPRIIRIAHNIAVGIRDLTRKPAVGLW